MLGAVLVAVGFGILPQAWAADPASLPRDDFWVPNGEVKAIVETNGIVYLGGVFEYISPVSLTGTALDSFSGAEAPDFPKFNGAIKTVVADGQGGWFIGGLFRSAGELPLTNLAHIKADRSVDAEWRPNPDNIVLALAPSASRLYVGGSFNLIGGVARTNLAALDLASGAVLSDWKADATTYSLKPASVNALVLAGDLLYVGGFFSYVNATLREHVASVDASTGAVTPWYPNVYSGSQAMARVDALALGQNILYVGGTFRAMGANFANQPNRSFLAALDTTLNGTNSMTEWNPSASGPVTSLAVSCDTVYVGGSFTNIGGQPRHSLAALDRSAGLATGWDPNGDGDVLVLALAGHTLYAGGKFTRLGGQPRNFLAALDIHSGQATPWNPKADFGVAGLAIAGQSVVTGGALGSGGKMRKNAAAFDVRTGQPLDWEPQVTGGTVVSSSEYTGVYAMAASSDTVYLGGPFGMVNGQPRSHLAAVDAHTGALTGWNPTANGIVQALAVSGSIVFAGGSFTTNGGAPRSKVAALDAASGSAIPNWNPGANDKVTALTCLSDLVYAGGRFTVIGGQPCSRLAAVDASGAATDWNPDVNDQVSSVAISGQTFYLGGQFTMVDGEPRNKLGAVQLATGLVLPWDAQIRFLTPAGERTAAVNALSVSDQATYVGGAFTSVAGQPRKNLAAIGPDSPATVTAWDPNVDSSVNALVVSDQRVYAGGVFQSVGGRYHPCFAVFPPLGSPVISRQPRSLQIPLRGAASFSVEATGQEPLFFQWQLNGTNIPGATGPTHLLAEAQVADSGDYRVVVTNALGLVNSRPATLTVIEPLRILTQPASQTVLPGTTVTLSVVVAGHPPPIYQWRLNGMPIPGGVYPTLTISNAQPTDGGSYQVALANLTNAVSSDIATLVVTSPTLSLADNLEARVTYTDAAFVGSGHNVGATRQTGEPKHAGFRGGSSVWLSWITPANGIATFATRGSAFDTLLAIYTGTSLTDLVPVAADDDDRGGFYTSRASFNATAGTEYLVAVDGFSAGSGPVVLIWNLDTTTVDFPHIIQQPRNQVVHQGDTATFSVTVSSPTPTRFQWYSACLPLPDATNASLVIPNVQPSDVDNYRVLVMNGSARLAESVEASLEISSNPLILSREKEEEVPAGPGVGTCGPGPAAIPASTEFISVSVGTVGWQWFNNLNAGSSECNYCQVLGGASKFLPMRAEDDGILVLDTIESGIDTVVAVYFYAGLRFSCANLVLCDNDSAPDRVRSRVRFQGSAGRSYRVYVDGVNADRGDIKLNWRMGLPPTPVPPAVLDRRVWQGKTLILQAESAGAFPATHHQWLHNGLAMPGQTNAILVLDQVLTNQHGTYSVSAENDFGVTTQLMAVVTVEIPYLSVQPGPGPGSIRVRGQGPAGQVLVLETSPDLVSWHPLAIHTLSVDPFYLDLPATNWPGNFLRARPWP